MSEEEDEFGDIAGLSELSLKSNSDRFQVSGWEQEDEGIEQEKNPRATPSKEILWAAENGKIDIVKHLVKRDNKLVEVTDNDGYTPLHRACYNGHTEIVEFLLLNGANHGKVTLDNWQPLHSACKWNQADCAALLISHGADINATSRGGITALHLAAGHSEARKLLEMLLTNPQILVDFKDESGDTPHDIARRSGPNEKLFEAVEPCFSILKIGSDSKS